MKPLTLFLIALVALSTPVAAGEQSLYNAQDTVRKAQIGTHSPRLSPPVRVKPERGAGPDLRPGAFDRLYCRIEPVGEPRGTIVCKPRSTN